MFTTSWGKYMVEDLLDVSKSFQLIWLSEFIQTTEEE